MSRIRSVHPGLWTDVAFVALSFPARQLLIGLWNECDDMGSFQYSPLRLKMRIMPADNVDINELLDELTREDWIIRYEVEGKEYAAVRNFCKFQRPQKPSSQFPQTVEVQKYVALDARNSRNGKGEVDDEYGNDTGKSRPMEDGVVNRNGITPPTPQGDEKPVSKRKSVVLPEPPGDWKSDDIAAWKKWIQHRREIGHPLKPTTAESQIATLSKHGDPAAVIGLSITSGYQGLFPDRVPKRRQKGFENTW